MSEALQLTVHFHGGESDVDRVAGIIKSALPDFRFYLADDGNGNWALVPHIDSKYFVEMREE